MQRTSAPRPRRAPRRPSAHRRDGRAGLARARRRLRRRRLLQLLAETKSIDGRGVELSRERVNACVTRGLSVIQGDADRDLADYPDRRSTTRSSALPSRRRVIPRRCWRTSCASAAAPSSRSRTLVTGASAPNCCSPGACRRPRICRSPGTPAPTPTCAPSRILPTSSPSSTPRSRAPSPSTLPGNGCPIDRSISLQNLLGEKAVFLLRKCAIS